MKFKEQLPADAKLKLLGIQETLHKAEQSRHVYGEYKESYIHDVTFLLNLADAFQAALEDVMESYSDRDFKNSR